MLPAWSWRKVAFGNASEAAGARAGDGADLGTAWASRALAQQEVERRLVEGLGVLVQPDV